MKKLTILIYGLLSYLIFLGVFIYAIGFIGNFAVTNSLDALPNKPIMTAVMINLGLLAAFSLQHSGMARKGFKNRLTKYIPQSAERSTYVLASNLALIAIFVFWQPMGGVIWSFQSDVIKSLIITLYMFGWSIVLVSTFLINHFQLFGFKQVWYQFIEKKMPPSKFVSPSLYKVVRHPMYVGWIIVFWATATMTVAHLLFAIMCTAYIVVGIFLEEKDLVTELGVDYLDYQKQVPKLIPSQKFTKPVKTTTLMVIILLLGIIFSSSSFAIVTLGNDADCDYSTDEFTIQDLIDMNEPTIRLTTQVIHFENLVINKSVLIVGSFENCSDAELNRPSDNNTVINGSTIDTVINFRAENENSNLFLAKITIINGLSATILKGGGITVRNPNLVTVKLFTNDVIVANNSSIHGGGVNISGEDISWFAESTTILNNVANGNGGGIYCNNSNITLRLKSGVAFNKAENILNTHGNGGGIYAANECDINILTEITDGLLDYRGVNNNSSTSHGGGIYASSDSTIHTFNDSSLVNISHNTADSNNNGFGEGGGVYLTGNLTRLDSIGALITGNKAANGAGVSVNNNATLKLTNTNNSCWNVRNCNEVSFNTTTGEGNGGAIYIKDHSIVSLINTYVFSNRANLGTIAYLEDGSNILLNNVTAYANGDRFNDDWNDSLNFFADRSGVQIANSTLANNYVNSAVVELHNHGNLKAINSIIYEPITNKTLIKDEISIDAFDCVVTDNTIGLTIINDSLVTSTPGFVNSNSNNYHLTSQSPAIDLCQEAPIVQLPYDIDGENVNVDDPNTINVLGAFDAGSDEWQTDVDIIFTSGFEL